MIIHGDCLRELKALADNSIDSIVTDPPYGLSFMGKKWDYDVPSVEIWREALRVLKPGGHLLSFAGTRTYHRMACNIEDAGFEIRDQIMWLYGSGFPKSHDVSKAIDKAAGEYVPGSISPNSRSSGESPSGCYGEGVQTKRLPNPQSEAAKQWQGWGSALKPANEPIVVARKPLEKGLTLAANVLKYGTGALNIDASRIGVSESEPNLRHNEVEHKGEGQWLQKVDTNPHSTSLQGRWPANVLLDEEAAVALDEQSGSLKAGGKVSGNEKSKPAKNTYGEYERKSFEPHGDSGGASRFFYVAKASKRERNAGLEGMEKKTNDFQRASSGLSSTVIDGARQKGNCGQPNENFHPTVKPIKLMEYLIKLVTPPLGTVLDPFAGSGTTLLAAVKLNFEFIGIEREADYVQIIRARVKAEQELKLNQTTEV